jgi:transcriptional regulator with XRE-family HTH domain
MTADISGAGLRLRKLREMAGISPRDLADLVGVSPGYPGHIESGRRRGRLGAEIAPKFAAVLGCTFEYLVFGTEPEPTKEQVQAAVTAARAAKTHESGEHPAVDPAKTGSGGAA